MDLVNRFRRAWGSRNGQQQDPYWDWLENHVDMYAAVLSSHLRGDYRYRMQIGLAQGSWRLTDPRTHMLVVGPSQGAAGKSSAIMIPAILSHYGPCLATATKWDVPQATAMARSRLGDVWWYDPSGEPAPPGFKELRFSPIVGAENWTLAREVARSLMDAASSDVGQDTTVNEVSHHFQTRAGDLLSALLHVAAVTGREMSWVVDLVTMMDLTKDGELLELEEEMKVSPVHRESRRMFTGILNSEARERSGVFSTLSVALRAYHGDALRVTEDVNFDPVAFVVGQPDESAELFVEPVDHQQQMLASAGVFPRMPGRFDTVYVSMPVEKQRIYAPSLITLIGAVRRATYAVNREDQRRGWYGRLPVLLAPDEMYGSPIPDLPELLAEGAGQNLLILGAIQDLNQAEARWGRAGRGFLTLWQNIIVMRGLRADDLNQLSLLGGEYDHPTSSYSQSRDLVVIDQWNETRSHDRRRVLPPDVISSGDPKRPGEELIFTPGGHWQYFTPNRYFEKPWAWILTQSAEWVFKRPRENSKTLPLPNLARGGDYSALYAAGGSTLVDWFREVQDLHQQHQEAA